MLANSVRTFSQAFLLREYAERVSRHLLIGGGGGCILSIIALAVGDRTLPILTITFSTLYLFFLGAGSYAARERQKLAMLLRSIGIMSLLAAIILLIVACGKYSVPALMLY